MPLRNRNYFGVLALAVLLASGLAAPLIPRLGTTLLVATVLAGGAGVYRAWRSSLPVSKWILSCGCLCAAGGLLLMLAVASIGLESEMFVLKVGTATRKYRLYRPPGIAGERPLPAVIVLHGLMQRAHSIERISGMDRQARDGGFLVVYPEGFRRSWNDTDRTKPATRAGIDDIGFIRTLIAELVDRHGADPSRIYVAGFSNGGFLAVRLACALSQQIAGIAAVGSGVSANFPPSCEMKQPVPAIFVLGGDDPLAPTGTFGASAERWADRLGCDDRPETSEIPDAADDGTRLHETRYGACPAGSEVVQLTVDGGGHTWPGGIQYLPEFLIGRTSRDIDAGTEIWGFLKPHSRSASQ